MAQIAPDLLGNLNTWFGGNPAAADSPLRTQFPDQFTNMWGPGGEAGTESRSRYNGYFDKGSNQLFFGGGGKMSGPVAFSGFDVTRPGAGSEGSTFQTYGKDGSYLGEGTFPHRSGFDKFMASDLAANLIFGGGILGAGALVGAGMGGAAAGASGLGEGLADFTMAPAGGGAAFVPSTAAEMTGMGVGSSAAAGSGIGSILGKIGTKVGGSMLSSGIGSLFNGGSGNSGSGGGLNLSNIIGLAGGVNDAFQQNRSSSDMRSWLNSQQSKIDNLYNPGTPEYNALWDEMSRKDAAAGRNSQYGPRSVDLAARIAQIKADNTTRFTTGTSKALADALNQRAGAFSGLSAAGQRLASGNSIGDLLNSLRGISPGNLGGIGVNGSGTGITGGTLSNADIENMINGGGFDFPSAELPVVNDAMNFSDGDFADLFSGWL